MSNEMRTIYGQERGGRQVCVCVCVCVCRVRLEGVSSFHDIQDSSCARKCYGS